MSYKLCIDVSSGFGLSVEDAAPIIRSVGFDGCFTGWSETSDIDKWAEAIAKEGLIYQSVHSPFNKVHKLWEEGEDGERYTDMLIRCLKDCHRNAVPTQAGQFRSSILRAKGRAEG